MIWSRCGTVIPVFITICTQQQKIFKMSTRFFGIIFVTFSLLAISRSEVPKERSCEHFDIKNHHPDDPTILLSRKFLHGTLFNRYAVKQ